MKGEGTIEGEEVATNILPKTLKKKKEYSVLTKNIRPLRESNPRPRAQK